MALSGSHAGSKQSLFSLRVDWSGRQNSTDILNNRTYVTAKVYLVVDSGGSISANASKSGSVTIDGTKHSFSKVPGYLTGGSHLLYEKSQYVNHNSSGAKSFNLSASYALNVTITGYGYIGTLSTGSKSYTLDTIPRASTITTFNNFTIGNNIPWAVSRKHSAYTHNLRLIVGGTTIVNVDSNSASGTLSISSANKTAILNKLSKTGKTVSAKLEVRTYSGSTKIGSTASKTVTGTARDDDIRPTVGSISHSEYVSMPNGITAYIQNKSRLTINVSGSSGLYGATINSTKITFAGRTINAPSGTTSVITQQGTFKIIVEITDTRGVKNTRESANITVLAYSSPTITNVSVKRSNSNGTDNPLGTYITVKATIKVSSLIIGGSQKNSVRYQADTARVGGSFSSKVNTTDSGLSKTFTHTFGGYVVDYAYNVRTRGGDIFDWTGYIAGAVPTGVVTQHWGSYTTAFGKMIDSTRFNLLVGDRGVHSDGGYAVDIDTRSENRNPQWYWDNYGRREVKEFKSLSSIGLGNATGTYCTLHTIVPWGDSSGGEIVQIAYGNNNEIFNRSSLNATTWRAWSVFALGGTIEW